MLIRALFAVFIAVFLIYAMAVSVNAQECQDEGETKACGSNIGACEAGTQECRAGKWTECAGGVDAQMEICDNEIDDDCDGLVDECLGSMWPVMIFVGILLLFFMFLLMKMGF